MNILYLFFTQIYFKYTGRLKGPADGLLFLYSQHYGTSSYEGAPNTLSETQGIVYVRLVLIFFQKFLMKTLVKNDLKFRKVDHQVTLGTGGH